MFMPPYGGVNFPYKTNLNWIICQIMELKEKTGSLEQAFEEFQKKFDSELDQTVKNQLTEWLNDGTISNLIFNLPNDIVGKKICIMGDSISDENISWAEDIKDVWVKSFRSILEPLNSTIDNYSLSGRGFAVSSGDYTAAQLAATINFSNYDTLIIFLGVNDYLNGTELGLNSDSPAYTGNLYQTMKMVSQHVNAQNPRINVYVITPMITSQTLNRKQDLSLDMYRYAIAQWAFSNGYHLINGTNVTMFQSNLLGYMADGLHPLSIYTPLMTDYFIKKMLAGGENFHTKIEFRQRALANGLNINVWEENGRVNVLIEGTTTQAGNISTAYHGPTPYGGLLVPIVIGSGDATLQITNTGQLNINGNITKGTYIYVFADYISPALSTIYY